MLLYAALWIYVVLRQHDAVWGILLVLAGVYVVGPLLLPVRYRLDAEGVMRATRFTRERRVPWSRFTGFQVADGGRAIALRFASRPMRWLSGDMCLFVPDRTVAAEAVRRLEFWLPPLAAAK
jgi:hypothetical protein